MKIVLCDINTDLVQAWNHAFADVFLRDDRKDHQFEIIKGSIFDQHADALVSPGNSFGYMDGGLDYLISEIVGWDIQRKLQEYIKERTLGEILVGQAVPIEANDKSRFSYVICAPTMRIPMILGADSINVYLATKAVFSCMKGSALKSIAIPGMGTGVGKVPPNVCAAQMRQAFEDVFYSTYPKTWKEAQIRHQLLTTDLSKVRDLQKPGK